jgi:PAS domain S-box-containing protein
MLQDQPSPRSIADLKPGDHACCIYDTEEEHRNIVAPFLRKGLEQNEKVVCIIDARDKKTIINYLKTEGVDVEHYQKKGQFSILTSTDTCLNGGVFEPDRMMSFLSSDTQKALDEGYTALRVTGEMSWALRGLPGSDRLIEFENKLNIFFPGSRCLAICQYDRRTFDAGTLLHVLMTHPFVFIGANLYQNFYYTSPDDILKPNQSDIILNGWIKNIMSRKSTEEALRESEETFTALAENANDGILIAVAGGAHTYANLRASKITGYSVAELLKTSIQDLAAPDELKHLMDRFRKRMSGEDIPKQYETVIISKDGKSVPLEITAAKTLWHGQPAVMVIIRDITERRRTEEALRENLAQYRILADNSPSMIYRMYASSIRLLLHRLVSRKRRLLESISARSSLFLKPIST